MARMNWGDARGLSAAEAIIAAPITKINEDMIIDLFGIISLSLLPVLCVPIYFLAIVIVN
jgi:hypothetical protein